MATGLAGEEAMDVAEAMGKAREQFQGSLASNISSSLLTLYSGQVSIDILVKNSRYNVIQLKFCLLDCMKTYEYLPVIIWQL